MEVKSRKQERKDLKPEGRRMEMGTPVWTELDQHSVFQDPPLPTTSPVQIPVSSSSSSESVWGKKLERR